MDADELENLPDVEANASNAPDALRLLRQVREYRRSRKETPRPFDETSADAQPAEASFAFSAEELPEFLGKFELLRMLGVGGFAHVVLARDTELDRLVALKIPKAQSLFSAKAQQRFFREAKLAASLSHPAIVPVFEFGVADRLTYICYEYCAGDSLADWLASIPNHEKLDQRLVARIGSRIAESMEHAHKRGVIHRDLKPANVMLVPENEPKTSESSAAEDSTVEFASRLRVTDFGSGFRPETNELLTADGSIVGTPAYMSPEQAVGSRELLPAADIWSIGIILYEMVTRQLPFQGESALETLMAVSQSNIKPPSKICSVDRDLEAIILKCLNREPERRYDTAFALMEDLDRYVAGQAITARKSTWIENAGKWTKRNPLLAVATSAAFLSLILGLSASAWQWRLAEHNRKLAVAQKDIAVLESRRADKNLDRVQDVVDSVLEKMIDSLEYSPHLFEMRTQLSNEMLVLKQELVNEAPDDARTLRQTLEAYRYIIKIHGLQADFEKIEPEFSKAQATWRRWQKSNIAKSGEEAKRVEGAYVDLVIEYLQMEIGVQFVGSKLEGEIEDIIDRRIADPDGVKVGDLRRATLVHWLRGKSLERNKVLDRALAEFRVAEKYATQAVAMFDEQMPPETGDSVLNDELAIGRHLLTVQNSIGVTLASMQMVDEAQKQYQRVAAATEKLIADHPQEYALQDLLSRAYFNLANDAYRRRQWQKSIDLYKQSATILANLASKFPTHQSFQVTQIDSWTMAATVTAKLKHETAIEEAGELFEKSRAVANGPKESPLFVSAWLRLQNNYARFLSRTKQYDKSLAIYLETIRQSKELPHELLMFSTERSIVIAHTLAAGLTANEDLDAATKLIDQGVELARTLNAKYPRNVLGKQELARSLQKRIQFHVARNNFESVFDDANEIAKIDRGAEWQYLAATAWAVAFSDLSRQNDGRAKDELDEVTGEHLEAFGEQAAEHLRQAAELGMEDLEARLTRSAAWEKLRSLDQVQEILDAQADQRN